MGAAPPKVTLSMNERTDWLICKFDIDGIPESEIRHLLKSLEEKRKFHRLPSGAFMPLEAEEYQEIIRFINETGMSRSEVEAAEIRFPVAHALHLMESLRQGSTIKLSKSFRQLLENMRNPDNLDFQFQVVWKRSSGIIRRWDSNGSRRWLTITSGAFLLMIWDSVKRCKASPF